MKALLKISLPIALTITVFTISMTKAKNYSHADRRPAIEGQASKGHSLKRDVFNYLVTVR